MPAVDFDELLKMQEEGSTATPASPPPSPRPAPAKKALPPVMVVRDWDGKLDPTGWWVSEKYDGCRAWWDGKELVSRRGNVYGAPAWFKAKLPRIPLDGELWLGRGRFAETVGLSRGGFADDWKAMRFMVFDAPAEAEDFENRLVRLHMEVQLSGFSQLSVVEQQVLQSRAHLDDLLDGVEARGGEGLVLRRPRSAYVAGESPDILRVVRVKTAEAVIVGYTRGTGNRVGGIGSLVCRLPSGVEFKVGTGLKTKDIHAPPPVGTTITFGYKVLTAAGVPREPRFIRIRNDI